MKELRLVVREWLKQWPSRSRLEMEAPEDKGEQSKGQQVLIKIESRPCGRNASEKAGYRTGKLILSHTVTVDHSANGGVLRCEKN